MLKKLIGISLATALTLTAVTTTPAQAELDSGERMRLILGLGALAVGIAAAEQRKDQQADRARAAERARAEQRRRVEDQRRARPTPVIRGTVRGAPQQRHGRQLIPASCERRIETYGGGQRRVFGRPCLKRAGFQGRLPQQCKVTVDLPQRTVTGWTKRCLRRNGYQFY